MQHCKKNNRPPRVQMSIEGKILKREGKDRKVITKAKIDKIALTLDPVNRSTYADLVKSLVAHDSSDGSHFELQSNTGTGVDSPSARAVPNFSDSPSPSYGISDNIDTLTLDIQTSLDRLEDKLDKALSMQTGDAASTLPGDLTGAPAVTKESLDAKKKKNKADDKDKEKLKDVIKSLAKRYPQTDIRGIADVVLTKYKETYDVW